MAHGTVSVEVEDGLGKAQVVYTEDGDAYVRFYPENGVLIDDQYYYEYTDEWNKQEGYTRFWYRPSSSDSRNYFEEFFNTGSLPGSYKLKITGKSDVFPYKIVPSDGSAIIEYFYRQKTETGSVGFYWSVKQKQDGYKLVGALFYYVDGEKTYFDREVHLEGVIFDYQNKYVRCVFWFRKFTFLPLTSEKSKKLIRGSSLEYPIIRDGDVGYPI